MEAKLLTFLGRQRVQDRGDHSLRILTARQLLESREEAERLCREPEEQGLYRSACMLARAYIRGGVQVFPGGEAVLDSLSGEEILREMNAYRAFAAEVDVSCGDKTAMEALLTELRQEPMERIRWRVLRAFGVLPSERRAREMTEGDYLYCAMQLMLDREKELSRLCPECRDGEGRCRICGKPLPRETAVNEAFDQNRFEELKGHG